MLSFIQFWEHKRSPEMAIKVLERIKGMKKFGGGEVPDAINTPIRHRKSFYAGYDNYSPDKLDVTRNKKYYPNSVNFQKDYELDHIEKVPIKSIEAMQDRVRVSNIERILRKSKADREKKMPKLIPNASGARLRAADGHHHIAAAWALGKKHIKAEIWRRKKSAPVPSAPAIS